MRIAAKPSAAACAQNFGLVSLYSISNTGLPAETNGLSAAHSLYCAHCSAIAKSNDETRAGI